MADIITVKKDVEFELPVCEFTPENGSEFVGWKIGDKLYGEGDVVTLSKDTVIMAVWKVTAPDDEPVDEPTEIVTPVPDKPAAVEFVAYETKPDKKTEDDPSDTVANAGRSEERKAEVTAGNRKYRSPDSGDEPETLLWLLILVVAGIAGGFTRRFYNETQPWRCNAAWFTVTGTCSVVAKENDVGGVWGV